MGYDLRIESGKRVGLITSRTQNSRLWFINNQNLENDILAAVAHYQEVHKVTLYAFVLMANHYHSPSRFELANRAHFMRDVNAQIARLTKRHIPEVGRGKFWEKRYSEQELPRNEDIEEYFFYCALQAVSTQLKAHPNEYSQYNSFEDAINEVERKFIHTDWTKYKNAKRFNPNVDITKYQRIVVLKYSRLPGYEHLSQVEYKNLMVRKFEARRRALIEKHHKEGKSYPCDEALKSIKPGDLPWFTKRSTRYSYRPVVLCGCPIVKKEHERIYFEKVRRFKVASAKYLAGDITSEFPSGTYRPPLFCQRDPEYQPNYT